MATHQIALAQFALRGKPRAGSCQFKRNAAYTEAATCSDGQALPAASTPFRNPMPGYISQRMSAGGTALGQKRKIARPVRHIAPIQAPEPITSRRVSISICGSDRYAQAEK